MESEKSDAKGKMEVVEGSYDDMKDFRMDSGGYFLIRINKANQNIEVGLCKKANEVLIKIVGKRPQDIYWEVVKRRLIELPDHYAYLGKECQKAYDALKLGIDYVQDEDLEIQ